MRRLSIDALISSPEEIFRLRELLGNGGIAALPTETYYALAADPFSELGVKRIFEAKGRDDGKPLPVLFGARAHHVTMARDAPPFSRAENRERRTDDRPP